MIIASGFQGRKSQPAIFSSRVAALKFSPEVQPGEAPPGEGL
jgi:hypothetical protein